MLRLGIWQLARAEEKKLLIKQQHNQSQAQIWMTDTPLPKAYQPTQLKGKFIEAKTLLLDNQFDNHQLGFHVLTPFLLENSKYYVMVDRGFVLKAGLDKKAILAKKFEMNSPFGQAYYPSAKQWLLGSFTDGTSKKPWVIETLDIAKIESLASIKLAPFILRLSPKIDDSYQRNWQANPLTPEKHFAYAWQWFSFALVLTLIFLVNCVKKREEYAS